MFARRISGGACDIVMPSSSRTSKRSARRASVPAYVRGKAYLILGDGKGAVAEFRKSSTTMAWWEILPRGAGPPRTGSAYALEAANGPAARETARAAYQNFLAFWKFFHSTFSPTKADRERARTALDYRGY